MEDTKLILVTMGEYEFIREEILESELQERLQKYLEVIPEKVVDKYHDEETKNGYLEFNNNSQVIIWFKEPVTLKERTFEYMQCTSWCITLHQNDAANIYLFRATQILNEELD